MGDFKARACGRATCKTCNLNCEWYPKFQVRLEDFAAEKEDHKPNVAYH